MKTRFASLVAGLLASLTVPSWAVDFDITQIGNKVNPFEGSYMTYSYYWVNCKSLPLVKASGVPDGAKRQYRFEGVCTHLLVESNQSTSSAAGITYQASNDQTTHELGKGAVTAGAEFEPSSGSYAESFKVTEGGGTLTLKATFKCNADPVLQNTQCAPIALSADPDLYLGYFNAATVLKRPLLMGHASLAEATTLSEKADSQPAGSEPPQPPPPKPVTGTTGETPKATLPAPETQAQAAAEPVVALPPDEQPERATSPSAEPSERTTTPREQQPERAAQPGAEHTERSASAREEQPERAASSREAQPERAANPRATPTAEPPSTCQLTVPYLEPAAPLVETGRSDVRQGDTYRVICRFAATTRSLEWSPCDAGMKSRIERYRRQLEFSAGNVYSGMLDVNGVTVRVAASPPGGRADFEFEQLWYQKEAGSAALVCKVDNMLHPYVEGSARYLESAATNLSAGPREEGRKPVGAEDLPARGEGRPSSEPAVRDPTGG